MVIMPVREHNEGYFPAGLGGDDVEVPFIIRSWIDHDGGTIFIAFNNPRICTAIGAKTGTSIKIAAVGSRIAPTISKIMFKIIKNTKGFAVRDNAASAIA